MTTLTNLETEFQNIFQTKTTPHPFFAPGRINLIGEHTDYNGGHVFPASISFGTYALAQLRNDSKLRFYSMNFSEKGIIECDLTDLTYNEEHDWANYPKGMIYYLKQSGFSIDQGMDILFYGNIPNGAGLSSSASIELVTGVLVEELFHLQIDRIQLAKLGQQVENKYIGVNSGIMDQFAIGMGKTNHAILLDCDTLEYHYAPMDLGDHVIMIINTNKQRTLAGSKYNERRSQCEKALKDLQTELKIKSLGELTKDEFERHHHLVQDEINQKRAKHAVYENARTLEAYEKLQQGDLTSFGKLMSDSHESLRKDYEVTGLELDTIVKAARDQEGVLGARMTGAGFGGCAIAIIKKDQVESFKENVNKAYQEVVGYEATFYTATIGDGAKKLEEGVIK
ncbi:galactokinase [Ornithinibacillus sp. L9]|uniref:Galactokinase n=1 Tax=Ornithinibacillus caprae TaxID=2678566 RepID=A0A6N8FM18_9BACI|nr:galactokinase [Ornithinibacillus caprae]MUK90211.1 galactokinase [Ornithinibacillus caprae]